MARLYLIVLFGLILTSVSNASNELPCHELDSVDITDGLRQQDESIMFDNNVYPQDQYATVDYILVNGEKQFDDYVHIRGCACKNKPCIRLCCPKGTYRENNNGTKECVPHHEAQNFYAEVLDKYNDKPEIESLESIFAFVDGYPCKLMNPIENYEITHVMTFYFNDFFHLSITNFNYSFSGW